MLPLLLESLAVRCTVVGTFRTLAFGTIVVCGGGCVASLPVMAARPNREAPPLAASAAMPIYAPVWLAGRVWGALRSLRLSVR
jgi:hypothetical protein